MNGCLPGALQLIVPIPRDMEFPFVLDFFLPVMLVLISSWIKMC